MIDRKRILVFLITWAGFICAAWVIGFFITFQVIPVDWDDGLRGALFGTFGVIGFVVAIFFADDPPDFFDVY